MQFPVVLVALAAALQSAQTLEVQVACDDTCADKLCAKELGELKSCVHADGISQFVPQNTLLAVIGQLEQIETR